MATIEQFTSTEVSAYYSARVPLLKQRSKEWRGPCPIHKGDKDSFAVNSATGMAYCHSECNKGWGIIEFEVELRGGDRTSARAEVNRIIGHSGTQRNPEPKTQKKIVATYPYTDEKGNVLCEVVRYDPKGFRQRRSNGQGGWIWNLEGVRQVPYRLQRILPTETVYIVEGEKDVDTLEGWGFVATCNSGGAGKWSSDLSKYLRNKHVIIIPDNDKPGRSHAASVSELLDGVATSVLLIELPDLPEKGDLSDWKDLGGTAEKLRELVKQAAQVEPEKHTSATSGLKRFRADAKGIHLIDRNGRHKDRLICPPLEVIAFVRDFNGEGWAKQVRFRNREGHERTCILPFAMLAGDGRESLLRLLDMGFQPRRDRNSIEAVKDFIYQAEPHQFTRSVNCIGWHNGVFVFPDKCVGPPGHELVLFSETAIEHKYRVAGTLEEWRDQIGRLCCGNSRMLFAVSCSFGAPLLDLVKAESCGFHFRGLSSTGKTTLLSAAGSVWGGNTQTGFLDTWRATANGMEARATLHNHALLCLDEIGEVRDTEIGEIVYALGNGAGKSRMTRGLMSRANSQFKLVFLSTGERSLSDMMQAGGKQAKGGQDVRLTEVGADAGSGLGAFSKLHEHSSPDQLARAIARASRTYYGSPILAFLEKLVCQREDSEREIRTLRDMFLRRVPKGSSGEALRVAASFGLVAAGGELATRFGITGWVEGVASDASWTCYLSWLESRGGVGARDVESGIAAVRAFIAMNGASRFQSLAENNAKVENRAGFKECDGDEWFYFIVPAVFMNEICRGYDYKEIAKEMKLRGYMAKGEGKHLTVRKRIAELGNTRLFQILPKLFGEEEIEETVGTVGTERETQ